MFFRCLKNTKKNLAGKIKNIFIRENLKHVRVREICHIIEDNFDLSCDSGREIEDFCSFSEFKPLLNFSFLVNGIKLHDERFMKR